MDKIKKEKEAFVPARAPSKTPDSNIRDQHLASSLNQMEGEKANSQGIGSPIEKTHEPNPKVTITALPHQLKVTVSVEEGTIPQNTTADSIPSNRILVGFVKNYHYSIDEVIKDSERTSERQKLPPSIIAVIEEHLRKKGIF
jgi:hypothetical protein